MRKELGIGFWVLQSAAALLIIFFLLGQTTSLFNYQFCVAIGLQESAHEITKVGVAFAKGFAFGDTVLYIPMLIFGMLGLFKRKAWGLYSMFGAMAITVYWPAVHLYAIFSGKADLNLSAEKYTAYSILLPSIAILGLWSMAYLYRNREKLCHEVPKSLDSATE